jgi:hypothetical protein
MDIFLCMYLFIYRCQYDIQELKEVPVLYTGIYRPISNTGWIEKPTRSFVEENTRIAVAVES